jgi:hypothetical protein
MKVHHYAFVLAVLPGLVFASGSMNGSTDVAVTAARNVESRPVVSVVALSAEQAAELTRVRTEYQTRKIQLEAEYEAQLDAILAKPVTAAI